MPVPAETTRPPQASTERLRYVDAIRVLAIGAVLLVHVAEVFNPWDEWHITNAERSRWAGAVAVLASRARGLGDSPRLTVAGAR